MDHFDPLFENEAPQNLYIYGPGGSGKSAIVQALFTNCEQMIPDSPSFLRTSTSVQTWESPEFVYIDSRSVNSEFTFCYTLLDALTDESIPERGLKLETIQTRLRDRVEELSAPIAVAVDHIDEPTGMSVKEFGSQTELLPDTVCWAAIGREEPAKADINHYTTKNIHLEAYRRQALINILIARASTGGVSGLLDHRQAKRIADWSSGDAHDALAVVFSAVDRAYEAKRTHLTDEDVRAAIDEIPAASTSLGRVLALSSKKQAVLYELVNLEQSEQTSVSKTADRIDTRLSADISKETIKRYLYEMAEGDILVRKETVAPSKPGRNPSRLEARFPESVFKRLYDL